MKFNLNILILAKQEDWEKIIEYLLKIVKVENGYQIYRQGYGVQIQNFFVRFFIHTYTIDNMKGLRWDKVYYDPEIVDIYSPEFNHIIRPVTNTCSIIPFKVDK